MTGARATLLAGVGVAAIAVAAGVAVGVAPDALVGPASGVNATLATGVLGLGLVGYALRRRRQHGDLPSDASLAADHDAPSVDDPGTSVDEALQRIEADASALTRSDRQQVRERVRATAVRAYARSNSVDEDAATEAVATGVWTDDRVAAAFVGDRRAPRNPLRERLRGWLHPGRAFRRRARRAADRVHDVATEGDQ